MKSLYLSAVLYYGFYCLASQGFHTKKQLTAPQLTMIKLEYFDRNDFQQLITWINDEHVLTNWCGAMFRFPLTEEKLDWYIRDTNKQGASEAFVYKAVDTETNKTIGHISIGSLSQKNNSARISRVLVSAEERGKGYCKHMIKAVLEIGFNEMKLHRISLGVYTFNKSAISCYEKSGFVSEGVQRDVLRYKEAWWSLLEMSILENEWQDINNV